MMASVCTLLFFATLFVSYETAASDQIQNLLLSLACPSTADCGGHLLSCEPDSVLRIKGSIHGYKPRDHQQYCHPLSRDLCEADLDECCQYFNSSDCLQSAPKDDLHILHDLCQGRGHCLFRSQHVVSGPCDAADGYTPFSAVAYSCVNRSLLLNPADGDLSLVGSTVHLFYPGRVVTQPFVNDRLINTTDHKVTDEHIWNILNDASKEEDDDDYEVTEAPLNEDKNEDDGEDDGEEEGDEYEAMRLTSGGQNLKMETPELDHVENNESVGVYKSVSRRKRREKATVYNPQGLSVNQGQILSALRQLPIVEANGGGNFGLIPADALNRAIASSDVENTSKETPSHGEVKDTNVMLLSEDDHFKSTFDIPSQKFHCRVDSAGGGGQNKEGGVQVSVNVIYLRLVGTTGCTEMTIKDKTQSVTFSCRPNRVTTKHGKELETLTTPIDVHLQLSSSTWEDDFAWLEFKSREGEPLSLSCSTDVDNTPAEPTVDWTMVIVASSVTGAIFFILSLMAVCYLVKRRRRCVGSGKYDVKQRTKRMTSGRAESPPTSVASTASSRSLPPLPSPPDVDPMKTPSYRKFTSTPPLPPLPAIPPKNETKRISGIAPPTYLQASTDQQRLSQPRPISVASYMIPSNVLCPANDRADRQAPRPMARRITPNKGEPITDLDADSDPDVKPIPCCTNEDDGDSVYSAIFDFDSIFTGESSEFECVSCRDSGEYDHVHWKPRA